jgi:hypothetical protein
MIEVRKRHGGSVVALMEVDPGRSRSTVRGDLARRRDDGYGHRPVEKPVPGRRRATGS